MNQENTAPANRLAGSHSLYLRQHAHNPVDWYPWGTEALQRSKDENKPILLSIGYAACHWCHVMAHESFEDPEVAAIMNREFVNIKVDREERPDLDAIYMKALQTMTGSGGWPMTLFLTTAGEPFFAGTYFPPVSRGGRPSFKELLEGVAQAWKQREKDIFLTGRKVRYSLLRGEVGEYPSPESMDEAMPGQALQRILRNYDKELGGFGYAPKFPQPMVLDFLMQQAAARANDGRSQEASKAVQHTLQAMARGGIYDQMGGGFHRYSTDARWLVPHFEKMLYDNALLARTYLHAWQVWGHPLFKRVAEETLDFCLRELGDPRGGFYSSLDADSEGEEGRYYTWDLQEAQALLGKDAELFPEAYGFLAGGNAPELGAGRNILHLPAPDPHAPQEDDPAINWTHAMAKLRARRETRVRPSRDEKILAEWNGFMLLALAEAGFVLDRPDYLEAARKSADRIIGEVLSRDDEGRFLRCSRAMGGRAADGFLEDYASLGLAFLKLYEISFVPEYLSTAFRLAESILGLFADPDYPDFYQTADDAEELIARHRDAMDNAVPAGSNMAAQLLLRLARVSGQTDWRQKAEGYLAAQADAFLKYPQAYGFGLEVFAEALKPGTELVLSGKVDDPQFRALHACLRPFYLPGALVLASETRLEGIDLPIFEGKQGAEPRAYLCENFSCLAPSSDPEQLTRELKQLKQET